MTMSNWKSSSNISPTPMNAQKVEETSTINLEEPSSLADYVRVYIEFDKSIQGNESLDELIDKVDRDLAKDSYFHVRRKDDTGYAITADLSQRDIVVLEQLPFVSSVKVMEEAVLTEEVKKKQESKGVDSKLTESDSVEAEVFTSQADSSQVDETQFSETEECMSSVLAEEAVATENITEISTQTEMTTKNNANTKTTSNITTVGLVAILLLVLGGLLLKRQNKK